MKKQIFTSIIALLASFTYAADEASKPASVVMKVNGENKQYNLLGENQDPIDLGTVYSKEVTLVSDHSKMTLPDLGFKSFIVESAVPYTESEAAGVFGASMTFTTLKKSDADQIGEGFDVDARDYKTGNFGGYPAILCGTEYGLASLAEDWAYSCELDVWTNWLFSGTHPVNVGWANDGQYTFEDGETYTVAFYFTEYNGNLNSAFIHRNGGKYYKFNFTYSTQSSAVESVKATENAGNTWYTLGGQRVEQPARKGVYIAKGKKIIK